ncbi:MAG: hypothetical protein OER88_07430, partial [Planctomycetota bacterium]|nr:hypothetical protein [Planctomycetota bacterium]
HKRGPEPGAVEFRAVDPATDAQHYWIRLVQAERSGRPVGVRARREGGGVVRIDTENLRSFATTLSGAARTYVIDDQVVRAPANATFLRTALGWSAGVPRRGEKSAARCGPFKRAFANRFVFVYGEGDGEALARARYDQQVWWYRGNGDAAVITDEQFLAGNYADRNVILYGNRSTNRAFTAVLPKSCPLDVQQGRLRLGKREWEGNNLACLLVYPRKGEPHSLVGVFGATGVTGLRLGYSLLTYVAGVGYPDYVVYDQTVLEKGADGVAAAGWFNRRWRLARE